MTVKKLLVNESVYYQNNNVFYLDENPDYSYISGNVHAKLKLTINVQCISISYCNLV